NLETLAVTETMKNYIGELKQYKETIDSEFEKASKVGNIEQAFSFDNSKIQETRQGLVDTADKMSEYQQGQLEEIKKETNGAITSSKVIAIVVLIASLIVSGFLVRYVRKSITLPLRKVVDSV